MIEPTRVSQIKVFTTMRWPVLALGLTISAIYMSVVKTWHTSWWCWHHHHLPSMLRPSHTAKRTCPWDRADGEALGAVDRPCTNSRAPPGCVAGLWLIPPFAWPDLPQQVLLKPHPRGQSLGRARQHRYLAHCLGVHVWCCSCHEEPWDPNRGVPHPCRPALTSRRTSQLRTLDA